MKQPEKWRETIDPFSLKFNNIELIEVLGYPHAGNDVFYAKVKHNGEDVFCFIKVARNEDINFLTEIELLNTLNLPNIPTVIDYDKNGKYIVTKEIDGERLSTLVENNSNNESLEYMQEFGKNLALIHSLSGNFKPRKHRPHMDIPSFEKLKETGLDFAFNYLTENYPASQDLCFCHGDFHYANLLWKNKKLVAILDFELAGIGDRDFDIAWSLILRPSQKFMNTEQEINLFLQGYKEIANFNLEKVRYYMVLIYTHFYAFKSNTQAYKDYVLNFIKAEILKK